MIVPDQTVCDVCGRQKGEANHWLMFSSMADSSGLKEFHIAVWNEAFKHQFRHACGQQCLLKAQSEWMAAQAR